jgi:hypothetical protein
MEIEEINSFTRFDRCEVTKTVFLKKEHLSYDNKGKVRGQAFHRINYKDIKMYVRRSVDKYIDKGYKVVFEDKKQMILLIYNKL